MPETTLPYEFEKIVGTWVGRQDIGDVMWKFTFESNFAVRISSSDGYYHQGTAFVYWKEGLIDGKMRVPPGWGMLDVDITQSSIPGSGSKHSLGAYSLRRDKLLYCFSDIGSQKRPIVNMSREGIRCFELKRSTGKIADDNQPVVQPKAQSSIPTANVRDSSTPVSPLQNTATIIIDGKEEIYPLRTDSVSNTNLGTISRAELQFQPHAGKYPDIRRLELIISLTSLGTHKADGELFRKNLFITRRIPVGTKLANDYEAVLIFIDDGGRIYTPKTSCNIDISSSSAGIFEGIASDCVLDSAGEEKTVSSLKFNLSIESLK